MNQKYEENLKQDFIDTIDCREMVTNKLREEDINIKSDALKRMYSTNLLESSFKEKLPPKWTLTAENLDSDRPHEEIVF